jgi:hypothetical protein
VYMRKGRGEELLWMLNIVVHGVGGVLLNLLDRLW